MFIQQSTINKNKMGSFTLNEPPNNVFLKFFLTVCSRGGRPSRQRRHRRRLPSHRLRPPLRQRKRNRRSNSRKNQRWHRETRGTLHRHQTMEHFPRTRTSRAELQKIPGEFRLGLHRFVFDSLAGGVEIGGAFEYSVAV